MKYTPYSVVSISHKLTCKRSCREYSLINRVSFVLDYTTLGNASQLPLRANASTLSDTITPDEVHLTELNTFCDVFLAVCPDVEMEATLINIFGRRSYAIRRYWRMMYWMPKMKYLSPWPVPDPLPEDNLELAKLAIERITSVDPTTKVSVLQVG